VVVLLGACASVVAFALANSSVRNSDRLLLRQDAAQGSLLLGSYIGQVPAGLSDLAALVTPTGVDAASWTRAAGAVAKANQFSAVGVVRVVDGHLAMVTATGTVHRVLGTPADEAMVAAVQNGRLPYPSAFSSGGHRFEADVVGAAGLPPGEALYTEAPLTDTYFSLTSLPGHPFANIEAAVYLDTETPDALVLATTRHLPLTGERAVISFDPRSLGMGRPALLSTSVGSMAAPGGYILVMRATGHLSGSSSAMLPWALLAGGLVAAMVVAALLELSERRRMQALEVVDELEQRNSDLDEAIANQRRTDARFAAMVRSSSDLTTVVGPDGAVTYQSPSSEHLLGVGPETLIGDDFAHLLHPDDQPVWHRALAQVRQHPGSEATLEWRLRTSDGSPVSVESRLTNLLDDPSVNGLVVNSRDVSDRTRLEAELRHQAFHDSLTGLANRALFQDRLEHALVRLGRTGGAIGVLFLDLDDFKSVNDGRGHGVGDELLRAVTARLRNAVRGGDTLARLGGDEFAVLLEGIDPDAGEETGTRLLQALRAPFALAGSDTPIRASVGVVTTTDATTAADELLRNADIAMYAAKSAGKGRCVVFHPGLHEQVISRLQMESDLARAVDDQQLAVLYQAIVDLESGEVTGMEALMRWRHPHRGVVMPSEFIPVAESTGLIVPMGRWLLERACLDARAMQEETERFDLHLAVNLSARQLDDPRLVEDVESALSRSGLFPNLLTLEITESVFMANPDRSVDVLDRLKALGVKLSIDDFGTGYSSLAYLRQLPVDELKIDRSFVGGEDSTAESQALVHTIVRLAQDFGLDTVAEGIETDSQRVRLREAGCRMAQGFFFARPVDTHHLRQVIAAHPRPADPGAQPTLTRSTTKTSVSFGAMPGPGDAEP
jgi:diguanylate cyclase (GGDEF)-like protein/PAS domain S-box-containing protein